MTRADQPATHRPEPAGDPTSSADPVTAAQLRDAELVTMTGLDPQAMGEGVGPHDGTPRAGEPTFSSSQGAGQDVEHDVSEGRTSTDDDVQGRR